MNEYWHKQELDEPLFPDLIWSRPENKQHAGKLLIIGGNLHGFAAAAQAYQIADSTGIGTQRVLLPQALKKTVGRALAVSEFAPSTPSGSFSQAALAEMLVQAEWANGVLVAGDLGRNSETAVVIEKFLSKHNGQVTITKDGIDYLTSGPQAVLDRPNSTLVLSISQLQRLVTAFKYPQPILFSMTLLRLIDLLNDFTQTYPINIITKHNDQIIVAVGGQVSTTPNDDELWQVSTATSAAVWWLQNPSKTFEAMTSSILS